MRRAIAVALALAALVALAVVPAGSQGAVCPVPASLLWHATRYKPVGTSATVPLGRRLGSGTPRHVPDDARPAGLCGR